MANGTLRVMGIEFAHPVGVAAGYDRDGSRLAERSAAGFAFVEIGTVNVTAGAGAVAALQPIVRNIACHRLQSAPLSGQRGAVVGVSIGSQRDVLDTVAAAEIAVGAHALTLLADFLVVNLSRPGSASRDGPAEARPLRTLLERMRAQVDAAGRTLARRIPLLVKVAVPPESAEPVPAAAGLAAALGYDGVVAAFERWPSVESACCCIAALRERLGGTALVAVGGVRTADIADRYLRAGADLVQVFGALAETGPSVARTLLAATTSPARA